MPKFRTLTGTFAAYVRDGSDPDITPDRELMNGRITFTPVFTGGVIAFPRLSPPEFAHPKPINALIVDGEVKVEVGGSETEAPVIQPLSLMVTVDDEATQVWSWRAEFDDVLLGSSDEYVKIPTWSFRVPDGVGPVDLTELVPLKSGGSVDVTKGPRGAGLQNITAVDGQLVFEYTDGEETVIPVPEAVQGPPGADGAPGPQGETGEQGPEGPQGPAPDLLVGNITDATPTGKNLMLAATEGAARNALGLQAGATAIAGGYSELKPGSTQTNSRVWSPKNISDYVESQVDAAKVFVNVKDYGAVGDGTTDDTTAFQSAVNAVKSAGGGQMLIPPAEYQISGHVQLCSNIDVSGFGAVLVKRHNIASSSYAYFSALSNGSKGYGSGGENIRVRGIRFTGDFANSKTTCGFSLHHAKNVLIEQCVFDQCQGQGHCLDLGGCDQVVVRGCSFIGFREAAEGSTYRRTECIQIDVSASGAVSVADAPGSFDGLATRNVTVEGCEFLPLTIGETAYPAPNPIGGHAVVEDQRADNIVFRNNKVGRLSTDSTSTYRGGIHFPGVRGLIIEGNEFTNASSNSRVIALYNANTGAPRGTDWDGTSTPGPIDPVLVEDVTIRGNTFIQSNNVTNGYQEIIFIDGTPGVADNTSSLRASQVNISNNTFKVSMNAGEQIRLEGVRGATISGNVGTGVHMALVVRAGEGVTSSDNTWVCSNRTAQSANGMPTEQHSWIKGLTVRGCRIEKPIHQGVWVGNSSEDVSISDLSVVNPSATTANDGVGVAVAGAKRFTVTRCYFTTNNTSSNARAVTLYSSTYGVMSDCFATGYVDVFANSAGATVVTRDNVLTA